MKLKINKDKITHYILIYFALQYIGGRSISYFGSISHIVLLIIAAFVIFTNKSKYRNSSFINWMIVLVSSMLVTVLITFGGLSIGTTIAILSRFMIVWAAIAWNFEYFIERLIKLSAFLSIVSCILFGIVSIGGIGVVSWLFPYLNVCVTDGGTPASYGLFLIVFNVLDLTRNSGIFGEPGELQILVNLALYFLLFRTPVRIRSSKMKYFIIFIVTMMTNRSTTGLINTIVLLACFLFMSKDEDKRTKYLITALICIAGIYFAFFAANDNLINTALINKIMPEGVIDFNQGTASARTMAFMLLETVFREAPFSLILGIGFNGVASIATENFSLACSGLISGWIMFGTFTYAIIYGKTINYIVRMRKNVFEVICLMFMIINNGLGQPDILSIFVVFIGVYFCEYRYRILK